MPKDDITHVKRPIPPPPRNGWLAWEATVGYISQEFSPDVTLTLEVTPGEYIIEWGANLKWGNKKEVIADKTSIGDALELLWRQVEGGHDIIRTLHAAARRPVGYGADNWLDRPSYDALSNMVHLVDLLFTGDWKIIVLYRPVEVAEKRLQSRLIANNGKVTRGGNGATLRDACRMLYMNTAPLYKNGKNNT